MKNFKYKTVAFTIAAGLASKTVDSDRIPTGNIIGARLYLNGGRPTDQLVDLTIRDSANNPIFDASSLEDWQPREGGSYIDSMKPINLPGDTKYSLAFSCDEPLTAELKGQLVFVVDQTNVC